MSEKALQQLIEQCASNALGAAARAELDALESDREKLNQARETVCDIFGALHDPFITDDARLRRLVGLLPLTAKQLDAARPKQALQGALDSGDNDTCPCGRRYDEPNHDH